jgi:hypothetical protein
LREALAYMRGYCDEVGRETMPEIVLGGVNAPGEKLSGQELLDRIEEYRALGVSAAGITVDGRTRAEWCDEAERIGAEVIARVGG